VPRSMPKYMNGPFVVAGIEPGQKQA